MSFVNVDLLCVIKFLWKIFLVCFLFNFLCVNDNLVSVRFLFLVFIVFLIVLIVVLYDDLNEMFV